jgi:flagellar motor switch protein FliG
MTELLPLSASPFTGAQRAAVLIMLLDDAQAAALLGQLEPDELQQLGETMIALDDIGPEAVAHAVSLFVERTENVGMGTPDRTGHFRSLVTQAVGDLKASNLMQRIAPGGETPSLDLARWLSPEVIAGLIEGEHPQAIAVLLVQLNPEVAARVLHALPAAVQPQVVHRVATLGPVDPQAIAMLEELLDKRIRESHGHVALVMGGPREAADIINASAKAVEKRVMPELARLDKALAKRIEGEMFKFEHLFVLDDKSMGSLLREVDSDTLIGALKGTPTENREVFLKSMSSRAAQGVRDEIDARGRMKMAEVIDAQKAIVAVARRLAADGTIAFGNSSAGEDDYV